LTIWVNAICLDLSDKLVTGSSILADRHARFSSKDDPLCVILIKNVELSITPIQLVEKL